MEEEILIQVDLTGNLGEDVDSQFELPAMTNDDFDQLLVDAGQVEDDEQLLLESPAVLRTSEALASQNQVQDGFTMQVVDALPTTPSIMIEKSPQNIGKTRTNDDDNLLSSLRASECINSPLDVPKDQSEFMGVIDLTSPIAV